jgi:TusA-related sulfurtransferase
MNNIEPTEILNLHGVPCPQNSAKTLLKLAGMDKGEILEIIIDDGEPIENVPSSIEEDDDFEIINIWQTEDGLWHLQIKVK